jgi:hypothetical protein
MEFFHDGFGTRAVGFDPDAGDPVEILSFAPELVQAPEFAIAVDERVARLARVRHTSYARPRHLDRRVDNALRLYSDHIPGWRLADVLRIMEQEDITLDIGAILALMRQLIPAVALFSRHQRDAAIGTVGVERLILTPQGRLVLAEYVLAPGLEKLHLSRETLWRDYRVVLPHAASPSRIPPSADVIGMGLVAVSLLLGRLLRDDEYLVSLGELFASLTETSGGVSRNVTAGFCWWISGALQFDEKTAFQSPQDAQRAFEEMLAKERAYVTTSAQLDVFLVQFEKLVGPPASARKEPEPSYGGASPASARKEPEPSYGGASPASARKEPEPSYGGASPAVARKEPQPEPEPSYAEASPASARQEPEPSYAAAGSASPRNDAAPSYGEVRAASARIDPEPSYGEASPAAARQGPAPSYGEASSPSVRPYGEPSPVSAPRAGSNDATAAAASAAFSAGLIAASAAPPPPLWTPAPVTSEPAVEPEHANARSTGGRTRWVRRIMPGFAALAVVEAGIIGWLVTQNAGPVLVANGELMVQSRPAAARVIIDGEERGITPFSAELPPGSHILEVRVGRSEPRVIPVLIRAGVQSGLYVELQSVSVVGALDVRSDPPKARVTIDGQYRGETPLMLRDLPPGDHEVLVEGSGRQARQMVRVEPGVTSQLVVPLGAR